MIIKNIFGPVFPPIYRVFGVLAAIIAFFFVGINFLELLGNTSARFNSFLGLIFSLLFLFLGIYLVSANEGVLIDTKTKKVKRYSIFLGIIKGNWIDCHGYNGMTLLSKKYRYRMSMGGINPMENTEQFYEIYLLNDSHLRKIVIGSNDNLAEAEAQMKDLSENLNIPIVKYAPKIAGTRK